MIDDAFDEDQESALEKVTDLTMRIEGMTAELDALYDLIARHCPKS